MLIALIAASLLVRNINYMIIFLIPVPLLGSSTVCDSKFCFTFMESNITWSEAFSICSDRGQSLMDISDGISDILKRITDFNSHKCILCPPISFWALNENPGKNSYNWVLLWYVMYNGNSLTYIQYCLISSCAVFQHCNFLRLYY